MIARTEVAAPPRGMEGPPRGYMGAAVKVALEFIADRGLTEKVRELVSLPETAKVFASPPWPFAWMDSRVLDEIETLLSQVGGRQACVELGLLAGRKLGGTVIEPVLRMAMGLFGKNPGTVFANLDRFYSMVAKGLSFAYEEETPDSGFVQVRATGPGVPNALFDVVRGNLQYVFELAGAPSGQVDAPQVVRNDHAGATARFAVRW
jgi:hypothetical protein